MTESKIRSSCGRGDRRGGDMGDENRTGLIKDSNNIATRHRKSGKDVSYEAKSSSDSVRDSVIDGRESGSRRRSESITFDIGTSSNKTRPRDGG